MRLQENENLVDMAIGIAEEIEVREIQERGAFLHKMVIRIEKARKKTENRCERGRKMDAAMIAIPKKNAMINVLPRISGKVGAGTPDGVFEWSFTTCATLSFPIITLHASSK